MPIDDALANLSPEPAPIKSKERKIEDVVGIDIKEDIKEENLVQFKSRSTIKHWIPVYGFFYDCIKDPKYFTCKRPFWKIAFPLYHSTTISIILYTIKYLTGND